MRLDTTRRRECAEDEATDIRLERLLTPAELEVLAQTLGADCRTFGSKVFIQGGCGRVTGSTCEARLSCHLADLGPVLRYLEAL
jgi:hypothetical protein